MSIFDYSGATRFAPENKSPSTGTNGPGRSVQAFDVLGSNVRDYGDIPPSVMSQLGGRANLSRSRGLQGKIDSRALATAADRSGPLMKAVASVRRDQSRMASVLNRLEKRLSALEGGQRPAMGGPVTSGNRERNIAVATAPPQVGKGGVLQTETATFSAGAAAGTTQTATITDATRSRLTDTSVEYVSIIATGDLADPEELQKIEVRLEVNGRPLPSVDRVPADVMAPTLDGAQLIPVGEYIGSDADIVVRFTTTDALTTANPEDIRLRMYSGSGEGSLY